MLVSSFYLDRTLSFYTWATGVKKNESKAIIKTLEIYLTNDSLV